MQSSTFDKSGESLLCRLCNQKGETINHISECKGPFKRMQHHLTLLEATCWEMLNSVGSNDQIIIIIIIITIIIIIIIIIILLLLLLLLRPYFYITICESISSVKVKHLKPGVNHLMRPSLC